MLQKIPEFEIDPQNPFENDSLDREIIADNLTNLIKTLKQPFVLSISSPWGTGKSTFVRMWQAKLKQEEIFSIFFNAWENDFSDEPFISFLSEIEESIDRELAEDKKNARINIKKMKEMGGYLLEKVTPLAVRLATMGALDINEIADIFSKDMDKEIAKLMSKVAEEKIKQYTTKKTIIKDFRKNLEELVGKLSHDGNEYPVVFFVDELDRCRPPYAIELLESIKHIFSVKGVVFILTIDREQIIQSIKSLYGLDMKPEGYLRRFIDLDCQLPNPPTRKYQYYLFNKFEIKEQFKNRGSAENSFDYLFETFHKLASIFDFSLRVQEQCLTQINLVLRTTRYHMSYIHLAFLIALKAQEPDWYYSFNQKQIDSEELIKRLKENYDWESLNTNKFDYGVVIEATLKVAYRSREEVAAMINNYTVKSKQETLKEEEKTRFEQLFDMMERVKNNHDHEQIVPRIDMVENLFS